MTPKRFTGPTIRELMVRVKDELGVDAIILSNRKKSDGQFEILAMSEEIISQIAPEVPDKRSSKVSTVPTSSPVFKPFDQALRERTSEAKAHPDLKSHLLPDPLGGNLDPLPSGFKRRQQASLYGAFATSESKDDSTDSDEAAVTTKLTVAATLEEAPHQSISNLSKEQLEEVQDDRVLEDKGASLSASDRFEKDLKKGEAISRWSKQILGDIDGLHSIVRRQILPRVNESQMYAQCHEVLLNSGFSVKMVKKILSDLPQHLLNGFMDRSKVSQWLEKAVAQQIKTAPSQDYSMDQKTIITLLGATGIGKSTCGAKIAAGLVMEHDPKDIIMVSLDADHPHLFESYADIIGVDFEMVEPYQDLDLKLQSLPQKVIVLDSPGMGHKHNGIEAHLLRLKQCKGRLVPLLTINASNSREGSEFVIKAYQRHASSVGLTLNQCAITKLDEAIRIGSVLSVMAEHNLSLAYQSSSQDLFDGFERSGALPLIREAISGTDGLESIDILFGSQDQTNRFEEMRQTILDNVTEMGRTLNLLRQEMKNSGFADKARSSLKITSMGSALLDSPAADPSESYVVAGSEVVEEGLIIEETARQEEIKPAKRGSSRSRKSQAAKATKAPVTASTT